MRALRNVLFSNLGLRKFSTFGVFQNYILHLIFRYLNSATDFLPIDINFNVKIKGYDVSYFYQNIVKPHYLQNFEKLILLRTHYFKNRVPYLLISEVNYQPHTTTTTYLYIISVCKNVSIKIVISVKKAISIFKKEYRAHTEETISKIVLFYL